MDDKPAMEDDPQWLEPQESIALGTECTLEKDSTVRALALEPNQGRRPSAGTPEKYWGQAAVGKRLKYKGEGEDRGIEAENILCLEREEKTSRPKE